MPARKHNLSDEEIYRIYSSSGKTLREVAEDLNLPIGTLKSSVYRGKRKLLANADVGGKNIKREDLTVNDDGPNRKRVSSTSETIKTVEELIQKCKIDLAEWEITKSGVKKWDAYRKSGEKEIYYTLGKADGYVIDDGTITIAELYSVWVEIIRKKPVPIEPVLQPVEIKFRKRRKPSRPKKRQRAIIIGDVHFGFARDVMSGKLDPFHDERAVEAILDVIASENFDLAVQVGDLLDMASWSDKFIQMPEFTFTTQPAIDAAAQFLAQLRSAVPQVVCLQGNHELRFRDKLIKHMPAAYKLRPADFPNLELFSIENLVGFERLGIEYVSGYPKNYHQVCDDLVIVHGNIARKPPGASSVAMLDGNLMSVGFGHIHRLEHITRTVWHNDRPRIIHAFSVGCLCRIDGTLPGSSNRNNWQQGYGVVEYDDVLRSVEVRMI